MTTLASFYAQAAAAPAGDSRRYSVGAAYSLGERVNWGFSIAAAQAAVLSLPQYATSLAAAGLTSAFNAVDSVPSATFDPTSLSGLLGWWKADSLALSGGAAVTSWGSSGGTLGALAQATGANQPTFQIAQVNGRPAVRFDGTNDFLATSAAASPTAGATVFGVVKNTTANAYRTFVNHAAAATWAAPYSRVLARLTDDTGGSGGRWQWIVDDAANAAKTLNESTALVAAWQLVEFRYDQANMDTLRSGTGLASKALTGALTSSTQPFFLGADTGGATSWNGDMAEIVYYDRGLNGTEMIQVRSYLQGRYGV